MLYSNGSSAAESSVSEAATLGALLGRQPLLADLYELTMAQGYFLKAPRRRAAFNYFVRRPPFGGRFFLAVGIEPLLDALEGFSFSPGDLAYLESLGLFRTEFLAALSDFRFRGDVHAVREGTPLLAGEPLLRVEGSLLEAELVTGLVLSHLNYQALIATKAARVVEAARGVPVVELGVRRAHGLAGAAYGSRAAYVGGLDLTSNVLAGKLFDLPVAGTMAHSWVMSFSSEREAFAAYAELYPRHCTLLVDTYGSRAGVLSAIPVLKALSERGVKNFGVRLDSGEPCTVVPAVRGVLDAHGLRTARIVLSGDLDEFRIAELTAAGVPVDLFGVGSRLMTAEGEPSLSGVYKLAACGDSEALRPCMKESDTLEKASLPGAVNVVRFFDAAGEVTFDLALREEELPARRTESSLLALAGEARPARSAEVLLRPAMKEGRRLSPAWSATEARAHALEERQRLPREWRELGGSSARPRVAHSRALTSLVSELRERSTKEVLGV